MNTKRHPLRVNVETQTALDMHEKLSKRETTTFKVRDELNRLASIWAEYGNFIVVPLPCPVKNKRVLMLYLRVWLHFRSPSWTPPRRFSVAGFEGEILERVRKHIRALIAVHEHRPVHGEAWTLYLRAGLIALTPDPRDERARQAAVKRIGLV
jgi:hypothetical protein